MEIAINTPNEAIQGHLAESERLGKLTSFLDNFVPMIGGKTDYNNEAEVSATIDGAREEAVIEAFLAVRRIAMNSFIPAPKQQETDEKAKLGDHAPCRRLGKVN